MLVSFSDTCGGEPFVEHIKCRAKTHDLRYVDSGAHPLRTVQLQYNAIRN